MSSFYGNASADGGTSEIYQQDILNILDRERLNQVIISVSQPQQAKVGDIWFVLTEGNIK